MVSWQPFGDYVPPLFIRLATRVDFRPSILLKKVKLEKIQINDENNLLHTLNLPAPFNSFHFLLISFYPQENKILLIPMVA